MTKISSIIVAVVLVCLWTGTDAQDSEDENCAGFGFGDEQIRQWYQCWPDCDGEHQSPINIDTNDVDLESLPYLDGTFYSSRNIPYHFSLSNDNYTVTLKLNDSSCLYLEGGPLDGRYYLEHIQFCWGSNDSMGSEHTIDSKSYAMEGQWGLYSANYSCYQEASQYPNGVLRIAQIYNIVDEENPSMAPIVNALSSVIQPGETVSPEEQLTYDGLFSGYPVDDYYTYEGSFTTPPCSDYVKWLVYPVLNGVTTAQVAAFRSLQSTDGPLVNNFRPVQPLSGRRVARSDKGSGYLGNFQIGSRTAQRRGAGASRRRGATRRQRHGSARRHH